MKIALFVSSTEIPTVGGGYTFENQLLEALLEFNYEGRHTFILYELNKMETSYKLCEPKQQLASNKSFRGSLMESRRQNTRFRLLVIYLSGLLHKLQLQFILSPIKRWRERRLVNSLEMNKIDMTLSFVQFNCPTVKYPYIITVWDLQHRLQPYFPEVNSFGQWNTRENYYQKVLTRAAVIVTGTKVGKAEIERFYQVPAERIKVVPFFTPQLISTANQTDKDVLIKYNLPREYLFYPAQFWPHKNHIGLLLALQLLKDEYNLELPLVLAGSDKGNESYVKEMVKELDLSKQVYFLGFVPLSDMSSLYRNAFALSFMSFFGPDNLPPLEAMALGCPVIAANVSGAKEQLGEAALLVDPKKPEEIALAIKSLYKDSILRQDLIERGLVRANSWTAKDYIKEIFAILDDFEAIRRCWK
jgi:glycosyltransferase involved in cell wall biosynthesis